MKNKKNKITFLLTIILSLVLVLTGCGQSNKKALIKYYDQKVHRKQYTSNFDVKLEQFDLPNSTEPSKEEATTLQMLKGFNMKGKGDVVEQDKKINVTMNVAGQSLPFVLIFKDNKIYADCSSLFKFVNVTTTNDAIVDRNELKSELTSKLKGKYIDVNSLIKFIDENQTDSPNINLKKEYGEILKIFGSPKIATVQFKALKDTIDQLPEKEITKKDGVITATLDKKAIAYYYKACSKEYKKALGKDYDHSFDKELKTYAENISNANGSCNYTINFNQKKSSFNNYLVLKPKQGGKIKLNIRSTDSDFNGEIKKPATNSMLATKHIVQVITNLMKQNFKK